MIGLKLFNYKNTQLNNLALILVWYSILFQKLSLHVFFFSLKMNVQPIPMLESQSNVSS